MLLKGSLNGGIELKRKNKIIGFITVLMCIFALGGCAVSDYQKSLYKDDSKIASQADSYSFRNRLGSASSGKASVKFGTFFGMDTLLAIEASQESTASLEVDVKINSGDFKVVLISPDNKVTTIAEGTKSGLQELKLQKGKSRIKIVGNNAKGEVKLNIKDNDYIKVKQG
jgi:subtilisin-like proprotein convertase family protein